MKLGLLHEKGILQNNLLTIMGPDNGDESDSQIIAWAHLVLS